MFGRAIAEFEFTLVFADAPIDRFARGDDAAMTASQKRGALLFFGPAGCVACHSVAGESNEMFSDFRTHVLGVPQVAPMRSNIIFDGPGINEDFGLEQMTGNPADRYKFRTSPLRRRSSVHPTKRVDTRETCASRTASDGFRCPSGEMTGSMSSPARVVQASGAPPRALATTSSYRRVQS